MKRGWIAMIAGCAAAVVSYTGCGFFNPNNPPNPIWGIWMGPYPTTVSTGADSSRWTFARNGVYLFYALKRDGSVVSHEAGYYTVSGITITISQQPGGGGNTEDIEYLAQGDSILLLTIRGGTFQYRRIGSPDDADRLEGVQPPAARAAP